MKMLCYEILTLLFIYINIQGLQGLKHKSCASIKSPTNLIPNILSLLYKNPYIPTSCI